MKRKDFFKRIACISIVFIMTLSIGAAIDNTIGIEELEDRKGVSSTMEFEIPFDKPIKASSISKWNVIVRDSKNQRVDTYRELCKDDKSIRIIPVEPYKNGEAYTLYITKTVRFKTNESIGRTVVLRFTIADKADELPTLDSLENLREMLKKAEGLGIINYGCRKLGDVINIDEAANNKSKAPSTGASTDFSSTNVQVQGVDEADIVKTDGEYIYQVSGNSVIVSRVYPAQQMEVIKSIKLDDHKLTPRELYLDDKHLVVIGTSNNVIMTKSVEANDKSQIPYYGSETVKLLVFDITNKSKIEMIREIELEGYYLSSRKIDSRIYLISNKYIDYYRIMEEKNFNATPFYRDSALGEDYINIDYSDIRYFPESIELNYMIAAGVDLDNPTEGVEVSTFLGAGQSIYSSRENLYIAVQKNKPSNPVIYDSAVKSKTAVLNYTDITEVYRFAINGSKLDYTAKAEVPGRILNQFSMDEHDSFFRIATTTGNIWSQGEDISKNNLYTLSSDMELVGSVEDIAPGEKIYSVRFMGDRAYMVTFKTVDPLFVIDLKDAENPQILGALKIPGYSDYLHPYDENHIIGFGKDTMEVVHKDSYGNEVERNAYYLGIKTAIFDITDVNNPKEMFVEKIGDRGTSSELLNNHKALMYASSKGVMAFPVKLMEVKGEKVNSEGMPEYGQFTFQGAYVYKVDLENGFSLKGRITHLNEEDYLKQGLYWHGSDKNINRILYIDDSLYTISNSMIKANDIDNMKEIGVLDLTR